MAGSRTIAVALGLAFAAPASAVDPSCSAVFSHPAWVVAMDQIDAALADSRIEAAQSGVEQTQAALICLDVIAKPGHLARFGRQRALVYFFDQDEEAAVRWGNAARYAASDYPWAVPEDHPFRVLLTSAEEPPVGGPAGGLLIDKSAHMFLGGVPITEPKARAEVPYLVQIADKRGVVSKAYWQDGAAFPAAAIDPAGGPVPPADWFVRDGDYASAGGEHTFGGGEVAATTPTTPERVKPPKDPSTSAIAIPQAAAGGGMALIAGALYAGAAITAGRLDHADSVNQLVRTRAVANNLVIASAIAGVAAVGIGATAFIDDQGFGLALHGRF